MGYRDNIPHMDTWIMARPKLRDPSTGERESYYGAFPSGFLERAVDLLGVQHAGRVLHICGGRVKSYHSGPTAGGPGGRGLGPLHRTLDLDPAVRPDFLMDARDLGAADGSLFPYMDQHLDCSVQVVGEDGWVPPFSAYWDAALIDRPYTPEDAENYVPGREAFPESLNNLLKRALEVVRPGGRVGVLDYIWPQPPRNMDTALLAVITVGMGWNNRARYYTVYERVPTEQEQAELFEAAAASYAYDQETARLQREVDRLREELAVTREERDERYTDEEVEQKTSAAHENAVDEASWEHKGDIATLCRWGVSAGAEPLDVRADLSPTGGEAMREAALSITDRPPPRPHPLSVQDRRNVVAAAGKILEATAQTKAEAAERRPAPTPTPTPTPTPSAPMDAALEGFA